MENSTYTTDEEVIPYSSVFGQLQAIAQSYNLVQDGQRFVGNGIEITYRAKDNISVRIGKYSSDCSTVNQVKTVLRKSKIQINQ